MQRESDGQGGSESTPGGAGVVRARADGVRWVRCAAVGAGLSACLAACGPGTPEPGEPIEVRVALGEVGGSPGQFSYPRAMDAQPEGGRDWLWVVDKLGRVQKIDAESGRCSAWWRMPEVVLGKPTGVSIAPPAGPGLTDAERQHDCLWLVDTHYHQFIAYDLADVAEAPEGTAAVEAREPRVMARFGSYGEEPGQFIYPTDLEVVRDGLGRAERVYVSEYGGNDRITCLDGELNVLFTFGEFGDSASAERIEFNRPQALAIDAARDELIVVDSCNHRIGRFTLDGELVAWIGSPETAGTELGRFRYPWGVHAMGDGTVLVVEQQGARVQHIDLASGACLASWGRVGFGDGELVTPWAVTMIDRRAFVLDSGNNRILGFDGPRRREVVASGAGVGSGAGSGGEP